MNQKPKVLIVGSSPDAERIKSVTKLPFDHVVAINNAWQIRNDWDHCIFPDDFPKNKRPIPNFKQYNQTSTEYVKAQNHFGGFVYAGGTMAFTAGYWALYALKPRFMAYIGCDMIYEGAKTHFYGKGRADPLRADKTIKNLAAKSARLETLALMNNCLIFNLSNLSKSNLVFPRITLGHVDNWEKKPIRNLKIDKIDMALEKERQLGYFVEDGKYWKQMDRFSSVEISQLDDIWLSCIF